MATLSSVERSQGTKNADAALESWDPPSRISSLPPLDTREAQDRFLTSPTAVVESLGLRIPAALARHIRRSDPPPAPEHVAAAIEAAPEAATPVVEAVLEAVLAPEVTSAEPAPAKPKRARQSRAKKK